MFVDKLKVVIARITTLFTKLIARATKLICGWLNNVVARSRSQVYYLQQLFSACNKILLRDEYGQQQLKTCRNIVSRQVERFCCSYNRTLNMLICDVFIAVAPY